MLLIVGAVLFVAGCAIYSPGLGLAAFGLTIVAGVVDWRSEAGE